MVDQNSQVDKNLNNQNENNELFGWSDDIFENSDLLQPINTEVDTAHQVIKSQNDLNNFSGEIQAKKEENTWDEHFENLYDDNWQDQPEQNSEDLWANDDIFDSPDEQEKPQEEPEVVEYIDDTLDEWEGQNQKEEWKNIQEQEELEEVEELEEPEVKDDSKIEDKVEENAPENYDNADSQDDDLEDIDDIDDFDDIDEDDEEEDETDDENDNEEWVNDERAAQIKREKDETEKEAKKETVAVVDTKKDAEDEDYDFEDDIDEEEVEEQAPTDEEEKENITIQDYEKYDPNLFKTDLQKKFGELQWKTEKIHELVGKAQDVWFDLLWWNDDRQKTIYKIVSGSDYVEIEKEELNKEDESTVTNTLEFVLVEDLEQNMTLQLLVNGIELYDEMKDLQSDPNKKMQVLEKMNKFIFLLDEEYKKIQKYKKEKEERNAVKWVFRNF